MTVEVSTINDDLGAILHGTTTQKVRAPYNLLFRAGSQVLLDIDPPETKRRAQVTNAIYDSIYEYAVPSDLKGKKIIGLYPQANVGVTDNYSQVYSKEWNLFKPGSTINVEHRNGVKLLQVGNYTNGYGLTIDNMGATTGWTVGGAGSNLTLDQLTYMSGNSSLNFDIAGSSASYIEKTLTTVLDTTVYDDKGAFFVWVYLPTASAITSWNLRWGNSNTVYFNRTVTTAHFGAFANGWNLLRFDWDGATETGTVDPTALDYFRLTVNHTATDTDIRVDSLLLKLGQINDLLYYTNMIWQNSVGTYIERPSALTDVLVLDVESYNVYLAKLAELAAQQIQGEDASFDLTYFKGEYTANKSKYGAMYKSEALRPSTSYYDVHARHDIRIK